MMSMHLTTAQLWALAAGLALVLILVGMLWQWATNRMRRRLRVGAQVTLRIWGNHNQRATLITCAFATVTGINDDGVWVHSLYGTTFVSWQQVTLGGTYVDHYAPEGAPQ